MVNLSIMPAALRRVARALRAGGTEVIEVGAEGIAPLKPGEALVRVEAAGLNHAETLIRSGRYVVRLPFPYALGGEGSGTVIATGPDTSDLSVGARVCWGAVLGSCATFVTAPASLLAPIPDELGFEEAACIPAAGLTAGGLARVWPVAGRSAAVWGAAGGVGRMLTAILAEQGVDVIGIASGGRIQDVRAIGARLAIDRTIEDAAAAVRAHTGGRGVDAVFDPIGAATLETSLRMLAPRGLLISYGELSGPPVIDLHELFRGSFFVTKYNGLHWVEGIHEFPVLIRKALARAVKNRAVISDIAGRFALDDAAQAYRALESGAQGKVLVLPNAARLDPWH